MDDLISRQMAIEALEDAGMTNYLATGDFYGIINALTVIKNMPTAEPDVIHCKECVYYENETHGLCDLGGEWAPDDYCSYGRRPKHG